MTVIVLQVFPRMSWVGLRCVIVFPGHICYVTVCMPGFKPNHGFSYGFLFIFTTVGQTSDSMSTMALILISGSGSDVYLWLGHKVQHGVFLALSVCELRFVFPFSFSSHYIGWIDSPI